MELAGTLPWEASRVGSIKYSNSNCFALGLLIQDLRHQPFVQVMKEEVFDPLGLKNTTLDRVDLQEAGLQHGYMTVHGERIDTTDNFFFAGNPAQGGVSSLAEVNLLMAGIFQGRAISPASLREMKTSPGFAPHGLGGWQHADGCSTQSRYVSQGLFWSYVTVAASSADGRYQAALTVTTPPLPTLLGDESTGNKRELPSGQIQSTLNETLDRLCASQMSRMSQMRKYVGRYPTGCPCEQWSCPGWISCPWMHVRSGASGRSW